MNAQPKWWLIRNDILLDALRAVADGRLRPEDVMAQLEEHAETEKVYPREV